MSARIAGRSLDHLSVSQARTYSECAYRWWLQRRYGARERPAAWQPQGTAVHTAAEAHERSGRVLSTEAAQAVFADSYEHEINTLCEATPNLDYWHSSGQYHGEADIGRRFQIGLNQTAAYVRHANARRDTVWTAPDGKPGIELEFFTSLAAVPIRGFIDLVVNAPEGTRVRDNKTGSIPADTFQLGTYAAALRRQYGADVSTGDYWLGKTGSTSRKVYDLSEWPDSRLEDTFGSVAEGIQNERFDPAPGAQCARCPVADSCPYKAR